MQSTSTGTKVTENHLKYNLLLLSVNELEVQRQKSQLSKHKDKDNIYETMTKNLKSHAPYVPVLPDTNHFICMNT